MYTGSPADFPCEQKQKSTWEDKEVRFMTRKGKTNLTCVRVNRVTPHKWKESQVQRGQSKGKMGLWG